MSTLGDLITEQIKKRQAELQKGNQNAQDMTPEDQSDEEEKKNQRFAKIKKFLGY